MRSILIKPLLGRLSSDVHIAGYVDEEGLFKQNSSLDAGSKGESARMIGWKDV